MNDRGTFNLAIANLMNIYELDPPRKLQSEACTEPMTIERPCKIDEIKKLLKKKGVDPSEFIEWGQSWEPSMYGAESTCAPLGRNCDRSKSLRQFEHAASSRSLTQDVPPGINPSTETSACYTQVSYQKRSK